MRKWSLYLKKYADTYQLRYLYGDVDYFDSTTKHLPDIGMENNWVIKANDAYVETYSIKNKKLSYWVKGHRQRVNILLRTGDFELIAQESPWEGLSHLIFDEDNLHKYKDSMKLRKKRQYSKEYLEKLKARMKALQKPKKSR